MNYYEVARKASSEINNHPGLTYLQQVCQTSPKVLDVGCGEGTRLNTLLGGNKTGWGIDPNLKALTQAKKQYPKLKFKSGVGEKIPFPNSEFDVVYSAFSIEHCQRPDLFVKEMIRVCKPQGRVVILAPNYGAPSRRSPVSTESPANKLFQGLVKDLFPRSRLDWDAVTPKDTYHQIDDDTTFEPYVLSLVQFLKVQGLRIEKFSSLWELEPPTKSVHQLVFRTLGRFHIWPFKYWGPQVFVSAIK